MGTYSAPATIQWLLELRRSAGEGVECILYKHFPVYFLSLLEDAPAASTKQIRNEGSQHTQENYLSVGSSSHFEATAALKGGNTKVQRVTLL